MGRQARERTSPERFATVRGSFDSGNSGSGDSSDSDERAEELVNEMNNAAQSDNDEHDAILPSPSRRLKAHSTIDDAVLFLC